jgi:hypothetical protein
LYKPLRILCTTKGPRTVQKFKKRGNQSLVELIFSGGTKSRGGGGGEWIRKGEENYPLQNCPWAVTLDSSTPTLHPPCPHGFAAS